MLTSDFILNGKAHGEVGERLDACRMETGLQRPFVDRDGHTYVDITNGRTFDEKKNRWVPKKEKRRVRDLVNNGAMPFVNNATTLRKDEWIELDRAVLRAARLRLSAWQDLLNSGNVVSGFDAFGKNLLEWQTPPASGEAIVDMDGITEGRNDQPVFQLEGLPLPITHSSFHMSARKLAISRNGGTPFDTFQAEQASRVVAESIEKTLIGITSGISFGVAANYNNTPQVYGYATHPDRVTKTDMTAPDGTNGTTVLSQWLAVRELLYTDRHFGPYMVYVSDNYDQYLDNEFKTNSDRSLRERLLMIDGILDIKRLDFFTTDNVVMFVQMTPDVVQAVNGMEPTLVQWDTLGGNQLNFKVSAIQVPWVKSDYNGRSGIAHATTS